MAYLLAKILIIDSSMRNHYLTVERSPANRSISKALYSFSKTKRFFNPNKTSTYPLSYLELIVSTISLLRSEMARRQG